MASNKYADAAFQVLSDSQVSPMRSKDLVQAVYDSTDIVEGKYTYHYILKACKDDARFDTSERGRIGLVASSTNSSASITAAAATAEAAVESNTENDMVEKYEASF